MNRMFGVCLVVIMLGVLLSGCGKKEEMVPVVKVDGSGSVETVDRQFLPTVTSTIKEGETFTDPSVVEPGSVQWPQSEYKPLQKASVGGSYYGGFLYFKEDQHLQYLNIATNETRICCFDPLCDHGIVSTGGINMASSCSALTTGRFVLAREENGNVVVYYDTTMPSASGIGVECEIRRFDVAANRVTVFAELGDYRLSNFWFYGDELLVALNGEKNGIFQYDKKLTLLIEATDGFPELLGSDERGVVWRMISKIYFSSSDFSMTVSVLEDFIGQSKFYDDGYIYYCSARSSDNTVKYEPYTGEFDEKWSSGGNSGEASFTSMDWYRIRLEQGAQAELILSETAAPHENAWLFDHENGLLYVTPLRPEHMGYVTWYDDWSAGAAIQMGYSGKPLFNRIFKRSGGSIIALDLKTLKIREVYNGLDGDVSQMFGLHDGNLAVSYLIKDMEKIQALIETDPPNGNHVEYEVFTFLPMIKE